MSTPSQTQLAAIRYEDGFDVNGVLWRIARRLRQRGVALAGAVQQNVATSRECCEQMNLIDLRTERVVEISQDLGPHARGCRLDQRGLAEASEIIARAIATGADLVIINKFGKAESEGEGLLSCFADAVAADIPVLTSVRPPYLEAWQAFHGGLAIELPPSADAILDWCEAVTGVGEMKAAC